MASLAFARIRVMPDQWRSLSATWITAIALGLVLLMQLELVLSKSINWDEFFHFSEITQSLLGRPGPWLQRPYVHLFNWVPGLLGSGISEIQLVRLLLLPFELLTLAAIFAAAHHFGSRQAAMLCTLAYATGGYVFLHALSVRGDMIAAAFLTIALWIGLTRPVRSLEIAAIAILWALAFLATIKSVLYAPAFLGIALYRLEGSGSRRALALMSAAAALAAAALLAAAPSLTDTGIAGTVRDVALLGRASFEWMFSGGLFPRGDYLWKQVVRAPALAVILGLALPFAWKSDRRHVLLSLLAPLFTVAIYRNSYPYHFAFILPPAMIAATPVIDAILRRYGAIAVSSVLVLNAAILSFVEDRDILETQRTIEEGVQQIFADPVVYIDESGMIAHYPRAVGHFSSGWTMARYRAAGRPAYREAMETESVPLVIINSWSLRNAFFGTGSEDRFLPSDAKALRQNYLPHWGMVYVAGKRFDPGADTLTVSILVPGTYTVEGGELEIDGTLHAPGSIVTLARDTYEIRGSRQQETRLRWGDHLPHPAVAWPEGPLFTDF